MTGTARDGSASLLVVDGRISLDGAAEAPCQARIDGLDGILFTTQAGVRTGQAALCDLDHVGLLPGRVGPGREAGFLLIPDLCEARRGRVTARLAWLALRGTGEVEQRNASRIVPLHRTVTIRLPCGTGLDGEIEDLSKSGARIGITLKDAARLPWQPGTRVTVGKRYAVVVRAETGSIAVRFLLPFTDVTFNPSVVL